MDALPNAAVPQEDQNSLSPPVSGPTFESSREAIALELQKHSHPSIIDHAVLCRMWFAASATFGHAFIAVVVATKEPIFKVEETVLVGCVTPSCTTCPAHHPNKNDAGFSPQQSMRWAIYSDRGEVAFKEDPSIHSERFVHLFCSAQNVSSFPVPTTFDLQQSQVTSLTDLFRYIHPLESNVAFVISGPYQGVTAALLVSLISEAATHNVGMILLDYADSLLPSLSPAHKKVCRHLKMKESTEKAQSFGMEFDLVVHIDPFLSRSQDFFMSLMAPDAYYCVLTTTSMPVLPMTNLQWLSANKEKSRAFHLLFGVLEDPRPSIVCHTPVPNKFTRTTYKVDSFTEIPTYPKLLDPKSGLPSWFDLATGSQPRAGSDPSARDLVIDLSSLYLGVSSAYPHFAQLGLPSEDLFLLSCLLRPSLQLRTLNIAKCSISDSGLASISGLIARHPSLRSLNISNNCITPTALHRFLLLLCLVNFLLYDLEVDQGSVTPSLARDVEFFKFRVGSSSDSNPASGVQEQEFDYKLLVKFAAKIASWNKLVAPGVDGTSAEVEISMQQSSRSLDGALSGHLHENQVVDLLAKATKLSSATIDHWIPKQSTTDASGRQGPQQTLPSALFQLSHIRTLKFDECIDPKDHSRTFFRSIPRNFTKLVNLKHLIVSSCGMQSVDPVRTYSVQNPSWICDVEASILKHLTQLETLDLSNNDLKVLPDTIGCCTSLTRLSIRSNQIEQLPPSLMMLKNLQSLQAQGNRLTSVPVSMTRFLPQLSDLRILQQGPNPDKTTLIVDSERALWSLFQKEIKEANLQKPFPDTVQYMKSFLESKSLRLNNYKMVLMGDGAVGKTSTLRSILTLAKEGKKYAKKVARSETPPVSIATDGIEIKSLKIPASSAGHSQGHIGGSDCLNFSCWDFAGQDVYSYSHSFFLTEQSLYLIGFDASLGESSVGIERVDYWLQTIRCRFPNACCIVFGTHTDGLGSKEKSKLKKAIESRYLQEEKSRKGATQKKDLFRVAAVHFISNTTFDGIEDLYDDILHFPKLLRKSLNRTLREEIPTSWLILSEAGLALGSAAVRLIPIVSWKEWVDIAQKEVGMQEDEVRYATMHWHETGTITWFNEPHLRDIVCLRPDFLVDTFAAVISAKSGLSTGLLRHSELVHIWKGIPSSLYPSLLGILHKFEILHELTGDFSIGETFDARDPPPQTNGLLPGISIIPALLPPDPPPAEKMKACWPTLIAGEMEFNRAYVFDFVPNGFFSRLLVRLLHSKWKVSVCWRFGIVLKKKEAFVHLRFEESKKQLTLKVRGPNNVSRIGSIIESISTLIQDWITQGKANITITHTHEDGSVVQFNFEDLQRVVQSGKFEIQAANDTKHGPVRIDNLAPELVLLTSPSIVQFKPGDIKLGDIIATGGFANVVKGELASDGTIIAGKQLLVEETEASAYPSSDEQNEMTNNDAYVEFRREAWLMSNLQHPHIVRLLGILQSPRLTMILEFMEAGNLYEYLHGDGESRKKAELVLEEKFQLALGIARGMAFMHSLSPPIIHRDLKSPNILLTYRTAKTGKPSKVPVPKIADFGLSRGLQWTTSRTDRAVDNPLWLAPEILANRPYNEKADVYSFGVILYEIVLQERFLNDFSFDAERESYIMSGERPQLPGDMNPVMKSLIVGCWSQLPENRPSFDTIVTSLESRTPIDINSVWASKLNFSESPASSFTLPETNVLTSLLTAISPPPIAVDDGSDVGPPPPPDALDDPVPRSSSISSNQHPRSPSISSTPHPRSSSISSPRPLPERSLR